jgi:hypothetical protein
MVFVDVWSSWKLSLLRVVYNLLCVWWVAGGPRVRPRFRVLVTFGIGMLVCTPLGERISTQPLQDECAIRYLSIVLSRTR